VPDTTCLFLSFIFSAGRSVRCHFPLRFVTTDFFLLRWSGPPLACNTNCLCVSVSHKCDAREFRKKLNRVVREEAGTWEVGKFDKDFVLALSDAESGFWLTTGRGSRWPTFLYSREADGGRTESTSVCVCVCVRASVFTQGPVLLKAPIDNASK